jgi:dTDP-glucose 4,6-dehydratase
MRNRVNTPHSDLNYIFNQTASFWEALRGQRIFITGGTGFFGCWLLETFIWANTKLSLNAKAVILTRHKLGVAKNHPHLFKNSALHFVEGDVRDFRFPEGNFSHIIHAATDASMHLSETNPTLIWDTIVQGTKHTLEFAIHCKAKNFLLVSSGAVYGKQPPHVSYLTENHPCQPKLDDFRSAYAVGKCAAEHMCSLYAKQYGLDVKIARCFSFIGSYLPLNAHFAIGNFIRDGLSGGPIIVNGDGTPSRSYLYAADLMVWLWIILFRGETARPYNVGSDKAYTIAELAHIVAENFSSRPAVKIMELPKLNAVPDRYIPDVSRAREELGLVARTDLKQAIQATINWSSYLGQ